MHAFFGEAINRSSILNDHFRPGPFAHLRKVDATKTKPRDQYAYALSYRLVADRIYGTRNPFRTVGIRPRVIDLCLRLLDAHLERSVGHLKRPEVEPVLWQI